jgi:hypothetical protein
MSGARARIGAVEHLAVTDVKRGYPALLAEVEPTKWPSSRI